MPSQLSVFVLVLLCWYWPWLLFSDETPGCWLASVISVQMAFVMLCNKISREKWVTAIIIVEVLCMIANIALVILSSKSFHFHSEMILAAFIIEVLIIAISLRLEGVSDNSRRARINLHSIFNSCDNMLAKNRGGAHQ